jgi:hypothetical protein
MAWRRYPYTIRNDFVTVDSPRLVKLDRVHDLAEVVVGDNNSATKIRQGQWTGLDLRRHTRSFSAAPHGLDFLAADFPVSIHGFNLVRFV